MRNAKEIAKEATYTRLANGDWAIEGASIIWKNFSGKPTDVNPAGGKRTFSLVLTKDVADALVEEGWRVKCRAPQDEGDDELLYTEIVVNMESQYPPKLHMLTRYGDRERLLELNSENISELDRNVLYDVDLVVHPYAHGRTNSAGTTIKGYLKTLYATQESPMDFGGKYARFYGD